MSRLHPAIAGALILALLGLPGALILFAAPPPQSGTITPLALMAWTVLSGVAGGVGYRLADRGRFPIPSWIVGTFAAGAMLIVLAPAMLAIAGIGADVTIFADRRVLFLVGCATIVAGSILVDAARRGERRAGRDPYSLSPSGFRYGTFFVIALTFALNRNAPAEAEPPMPQSAEEARRILADAEAVARGQPKSRDAQVRYGLALTYLDRHAEAIERLEAARRLDTTDLYTLGSLGWAYMRARRFEEALPLLLRAADEWPDDPNSRYNAGWTLLNVGRYADAERHYRALLRLDSTSAQAHSDLGWALHRQDKDSAALAHVTRGLELDPDMVEVQAFAGMLLQEQARFTEARERFREAARRAPERADFHAMVGISSYLMQDAASAAAAFDEAWKSDSTYFDRSQLAADMRREARQGRTGDVSARQAGEPVSGRKP